MIRIFPIQKVYIDPRARRARLVVCTTDPDGNLHVLGLEQYLRRGRHRPGQAGREGRTLQNPYKHPYKRPAEPIQTPVQTRIVE
jgi:hypothetical protein